LSDLNLVDLLMDRAGITRLNSFYILLKANVVLVKKVLALVGDRDVDAARWAIRSTTARWLDSQALTRVSAGA
jgi:hypothetical protein